MEELFLIHKLERKLMDTGSPWYFHGLKKKQFQAYLVLEYNHDTGNSVQYFGIWKIKFLKLRHFRVPIKKGKKSPKYFRNLRICFSLKKNSVGRIIYFF